MENGGLLTQIASCADCYSATMRPVTLQLYGDYWDSALYAGRLYLFTPAGDVEIIDWDRLVAGINIDDALYYPLQFAYRRSNYLYTDRWDLILKDPEISLSLRKRFTRLSEEPLRVRRSQLERATIGTFRIPYLHSDYSLISGQLFIGTLEGVFRFPQVSHYGLHDAPDPVLVWDGPGLGVAAAGGYLGIAAGTEGLYQCPYDGPWPGRTLPAEQLSSAHTNDCAWVHYSIYASSNISDGYLASFWRYSDPGHESDRPVRELDRIVPSTELFGEGGYSWARERRICRVSRASVCVVDYKTPYMRDGVQRGYTLRGLGSVEVGGSSGAVIAGEVATFGIVLQRGGSLSVALSDGDLYRTRGYISRFRAFPRSKYYQNQLHVVHEDRLDVLSFNHDYFISQSTKIAGLPRRRVAEAPDV